jgi:hypothetical protein
MRKLIASTFVLFASAAAASPEVEVQDPGKQLSAEQFSLVRQATETALARLPGTEAAKCAFRNSWRGLPTKNGWSKEMGFLRQQDKVIVTVLPEQLAANILGMARVGSARADGPHGRWTYVTIQLNKERLAYWQPSSAPDLDQWVNAIAHEIGHTFGLSHGDGLVDWEGGYAGYFVTELGFCVASDGQTGSDRGDFELRRKRKDRFGKAVP